MEDMYIFPSPMKFFSYLFLYYTWNHLNLVEFNHRMGAMLGFILYQLSC